MNYSLIVNFDKKESQNVAYKVIDMLKDDSIFVSQATAHKLQRELLVSSNPIENADVIIAIGGDGTIIHTAKKAAKTNIPILGINTGRIGYLSSMQSGELELLYKMKSGEYALEERIMLNVEINKNNKVQSYLAFNDAVISKGALSRMIDIKASLNKDVINYRADGLIISTPTGSTAYSLSAGGPILDHEVKAIVMTPICPYAFFDKSLVLSEGTKVEAQVECEEKEAYLTVDGESAFKIEKDDIITISKSEYSVKLIKFDEKRRFYSPNIKNI